MQQIPLLYWLTSQLHLLVLLALLCLTPTVHADLSSTSLQNLIEHSDVIVFARPIKIENEPYGAGSAILTVQQTIKGVVPSENIRITWSSEVHEQRIDSNGDRLLFLKRDANGTYTGTQYGRSYWKVESSSNMTCKLYTQYRYPINMITIDKKYLNTGLLIKNYLESREKERSVLCLDNIKTLFN